MYSRCGENNEHPTFCSSVAGGLARLSWVMGIMNTNSQTHTDLIVSFHFDQPLVVVFVAVLVVALVVSIILMRKRQRR